LGEFLPDPTETEPVRTEKKGMGPAVVRGRGA